MISLTPTHHARLFSCIAVALVDKIGQDRALPLVHLTVDRYGEQRGHRMALRAKKNTHPLDAVSYLAYGEWQAPAGEVAFDLVERKPRIRLHMTRCPWYDAWKDAECLDLGAMFCDRIDKALVKGFNPGLVFDVNGVRTRGARCCDFVFHHANLSLPKLAALGWRKKVRPGKKAVMPWTYHLGHLFVSMEQTIKSELGSSAESVMDEAAKDFFSLFPQIPKDFFEGYRNMDFNRLPDDQ